MPASKVRQAAAWDCENSVNVRKGIEKMLIGFLWGIRSAIFIRELGYGGLKRTALALAYTISRIFAQAAAREIFQPAILR